MVVAVAPVPGHTVVPLVAVDCILPEEGDSTMAAFELCRVSVVAAGLVTGHVGRARQPQVALFADVSPLRAFRRTAVQPRGLARRWGSPPCRWTSSICCLFLGGRCRGCTTSTTSRVLRKRLSDSAFYPHPSEVRDDGNEGGKERKSEGIDGVRRCAQNKGASVEKEEANE
ncbi:hypothetical protein HETIRDRAFT_379211 [Heterobasidion irregulare TC 32-1]|uniref:Uncharacterized protein n=1 Tax=Heterobasidion irregulare (strain TC 32-1) TaxID=747525 RepID=W4KHG0_HETIT|nr:uncharacterized protein HETIRDRAFT_379211 [Heterobasidion irregulare TC 32-1]ETW85273.1 hypothetical protein HETIRDRAFT_379211 [Heterobasidion irregulare TC 32-1]